MRKRISWRRHGARGRGDRGQTAIEYLGWIPILLLIALAAIQLGIAVYAVQQAGTAARAAARTESIDNGSGELGGKAAMSDWLADGTDIRVDMAGDEVTATAHVDIPSLIPVFDFDRATRSATMPVTDR
ncbi:TadE/TadG family type IV pilus assembly protein [Streptomyces wuyuanensis]|uniref:TadE/TadG family type IV pilus assembly protein n=1 Tax=Streptomyces wuyuanensis TaxID=1196353 RepID=UPI00342A474D